MLVVYDIKRAYGYYYDLKEVRNVVFGEDSREGHLVTGILDESLMDKDEKLFQQLWKTYFKAICIKERLNPRKHARHACAILEVFDLRSRLSI